MKRPGTNHRRVRAVPRMPVVRRPDPDEERMADEAEELMQWERQFRRDAKADGLDLFGEHLDRVGLPDEPGKLLAGTVMFMRASCAYLHIEHRPLGAFLALQTYRPPPRRRGEDPCYAFTFNLGDRTFARILSPLIGKGLDLADLYEYPWDEFQMCGYSDFRVCRTDARPLSRRELRAIKREILNDLRFDYTEDELLVWMDEESVEGALLVDVQDVEPEDENTTPARA